jgi:hypothetical protein
MEIAVIKEDKIIEIGNYKKIFPNVSFPTTGPDEDFMQSNSVLGVTVWKQHNPLTQKLIPCSPYIMDNQVFTVEVVEKEQEDLDADLKNTANEIRAKRNQLLNSSDWTQVIDAPVNKESWAIYRQELRDITTQEGFPFTIVWPIIPE